MKRRTQWMLTQYAALADADVAQAMAAYLKTDQVFFGVKAPERRRVMKQALKLFPLQDMNDYQHTVREFWQQPQRECQYVAADIAATKRFLVPQVWPLAEELVSTCHWWDQLDNIAVNVAGELVRLNPQMFKEPVAAWQKHDSLWVRRASILIFLKHKQATDTDWLAQTVLFHAPDSRFFIRKAIGWVLREYARSNPQWVLSFVDEHDSLLSNLSKREALKHLK